MKKWLGLVILIVGPAAVLAFSSGPPDGRTGAPGEGLCTGCHVGSAADSGPGSLAISGVPESYEPGVEYMVSVTLADPDAKRMGFEAVAVAGSKAGGSISVADARRTQISTTQAGRQYVKHTREGTSPSSPGQSQWSFRWTAPPAGTGPVTFYAAGNAANGDGSPSGDRIYTARFTSLERRAVLPGDLNGDGRVNVSDVTIALRIAVGLQTAAPTQIAVGDVAPKPGTEGRPFGDGAIDVKDVTRILRRAVGLEPDPWP